MLSCVYPILLYLVKKSHYLIFGIKYKSIIAILNPRHKGIKLRFYFISNPICITKSYLIKQKGQNTFRCLACKWSRRQDLNPQPVDYKSTALPLCYIGKTRLFFRPMSSRFLKTLEGLLGSSACIDEERIAWC